MKISTVIAVFVVFISIGIISPKSGKQSKAGPQTVVRQTVSNQVSNIAQAASQNPNAAKPAGPASGAVLRGDYKPPESVTAYEPTLDAVRVDAKHYTIDFENDHVRVVRVHYAPHEKSPMHEHPGNSVGIYLTDFHVKITSPEGTTRDVNAKAGGTMWRAPVVKHISENLSDQPLESLWIELKPAAELVGAPASSSEFQSNIEQEIKQLEEQRRQAVLSNDAEELKNFYADGMTTIDNSGELHVNTNDSSATLNQSASRTTLKWDMQEIAVKPLGATGAIAIMKAQVEDIILGTHRDFTMRLTDVWMKHDGHWQIVARQGTQIRGPHDNDVGPDAEATVLARTEELNQAFLHADMPKLEQIIADDCLQITQNGAATKTEWLSPYRNGASRLVSITPPEQRRIGLYGDVAVVTSAGEIAVNVQGERRTYRLYNTRTWVKRSGQWYLVLAQNTPRATVSTEGTGQQARNAESEAEARRVIAAFSDAGNKRDLQGLRNALNFPFVRIASGKVAITRTREEFTSDAPLRWREEGWHHSTVDSVEFIQSSGDKVHAAVTFSRYKADGTRYATYRTLRIITKQDGHWGIQCSSSFAP